MTYPPMLHPAVEQIADGDLGQLQRERWAAQWAAVMARSAFYKAKLQLFAGRAVSLEETEGLPFTDKEELRLSQEAAPPYGTYIACRPDEVVRIHRTSGTTGRALILANAADDVARITEVGARAMYCAGLRPSDRVVHCLNYQLWTGGVTDHMTLEAAGAATIPFGAGNTRGLIATIRDLGVTAISSTPSYPALLEDVLKTEFGIAPRSLGLRIALFGGEAGLDDPAFRGRLEDTWGFLPRNANFGLSEVLSNFASQCDHTTDLHFHGRDVLFAEIIDPATEGRLPIAVGTTGEIVYTHLAKSCQPLIRYRSRDMITVTGTGPCACGRTGWRFRVSGRTDDMFNVRGVNVFPTAVQKIVLATAGTTGHFRIRLIGGGPYDSIPLTVEAAADVAKFTWPDLARRLEAAIKSVIGARADITVVAAQSLPRTEGKTRWVERS